MPRPPEKRFHWPLPTAEQRSFVCAAAAVGLTMEQMCYLFPPAKGGLKKMNPERLSGFFAEELKAGGGFAGQLVTLRVLQQALLGKDREARAAQLAVFKTIPDWQQFRATAAPAQELAVERLTDRERGTLRRLLEKADPLRPAPDQAEDTEEEEPLSEADRPGARAR